MASARRATALMAALVILTTSTAAVAGAHEEPQVEHTYEVRTRGPVGSDERAFSRTVAAILTDARGWSLGGSVGFTEVASGGDLRIVLASPAEVAAADPGCSAEYSCRVGDDVLINDRAWREATPHWRSHGASLSSYRRYVVNHEVGHWLGYGHVSCSRGGQSAPVMVQQSIDTDGCEPNGWPLDEERADLGHRLGVLVHDDWVLVDDLPNDDPGRRAAADRDTPRDREAADVPDLAVTSARMAVLLLRALRFTS